MNARMLRRLNRGSPLNKDEIAVGLRKLKGDILKDINRTIARLTRNKVRRKKRAAERERSGKKIQIEKAKPRAAHRR